MVVEVTVRILRKPPVTRTLLAAFDSVPAAGACVAAIIADGMVPAAMEFMDRRCRRSGRSLQRSPAIRRRRRPS